VIDQGKSKFIGYSDRQDKLFEVHSNGIIIFGDHTRIIKYANESFIVGADGIQLIDAPRNSNKFLYYLLLMKDIPNTGYNRHFKFLIDFDFVIPELKKQTRIATILSDMDLEIESLEEKLHKARQIKQGMMQELLTGRVRLV
jgi:type I restriction enzyme S subunit